MGSGKSPYARSQVVILGLEGVGNAFVCVLCSPRYADSDGYAH